MARPRKGEEQQAVRLQIRVTPAVADRLCRLSLKMDESVYSLTGKIVNRVVTQWIQEHGGSTSGLALQNKKPDQKACYASSRAHSTLSGLLPF